MTVCRSNCNPVTNSIGRIGRGCALICLLVISCHLSAMGDDAVEKPALQGLAGQIEIQINEDQSDGFDWQGFAQSLIRLYIAEGAVVTPENIASAKQSLMPFGQVDVAEIAEGQKIHLHFTLTPYKRIKAISIRGNYPIFERDIRNAMSVTAGDIIRPAEMDGQKTNIIELYKNHGFIDPKVDFHWRTDPKDGHQRLLITIDEGAYYRLSQFHLVGNRFMDNGMIQGRMATWRKVIWGARSVRFEPAQLNTDITKLIALYRKNGFYNISVKDKTELDKKIGEARVYVTIEEGPEYSVSFEGNRFFSTAALNKKLVLEDIGNDGNKGLRRSVQALRRHYKEAGFTDVKVHWRDVAVDQPAGEDESPQMRQVVITIDEGKRHIVEQVEVMGIITISTKDVKDQILTRPRRLIRRGAFEEKVMEDDLAAIRTLFMQWGYLSPEIEYELQPIEETGDGTEKPVTVHVKVIIHIDEGVQTRIGRVAIEGDPPLTAEQLAAVVQLKTGDIFKPFLVQEEANRLSAEIAPKGYPHVRVHGDTKFSDDQTRADLSFTVESGPKVTLGDIFLTGNFRTRTQLIEHELALSPGEPFSLKKVLEGQRDVRNLGLFNTVQINSIGLKEKAETVPMLLTVSERKPYFFEIGGGYRNDKGVYVRSKAGDKNLLGTGKDIWFGTEVSQAGYRWDAGFGEPRLWDTRISMDTSIYIERSEPFNQAFGTDTMGGSTIFSRKWGQFFSVNLGVKFERRQQFLRDADTVVDDPAELDPRTALVNSPSVSFDNRDSFIRPTRGVLTYFGIDFSKGLDNELDDFVKYNADLRWFYPLSKRMVLATRVGAGYLHAYGNTDQLPKDQFFYLGGTTTVRGYEENLLRYDSSDNAVGGRLIFLGSVEGRYQVYNNWEVAAFVDTGSVGYTATDDNVGDLRWSAGLGLEYITPVGPIGLFYGLKLDRQPGERPGWWHFSIGYTF